ncbi:MAG: hypothetical protein N2110_05890 [Flavobacteriales bacterium]|nr:hypothetical protein [Flavobacteriales bacterium]MCX7768535.1 hypothetical protein [Flavobacteriales bacterium]MDW8410219.1 hypothetical protein [Flavobacteriales bacterium]
MRSLFKVCMWGCILMLWLEVKRSSAQEYRWGDEFRIRSNETPDALIGRIGTRFYSTRFRSVPFSNDELALDIFRSPELTYEGSITLLPRNTYIEDENLKALPDFEGVFIMGSRILLFLSAYDKDRSAQVLYGLAYDSLGQFQFMNRLAETHNATRANKGQFRLVPTRDEKILWLVLSHPQQRQDPEQFELYLFNDSLHTLGRKFLELSYKDRQYEIADLLPDTQGNLFMLGRIYVDREERTKGQPDYYFSLMKLRITPPATAQEIVFREPEGAAQELALSLSGQHLYLSGFYSESSGSAIRGTLHYTVQIDSLMLLTKDRMEFEKDFAMEALGEKKPPRSASLPRFMLRQVVPAPSGNVWIIGEQYWMQEVCVRDARGFLYCNYFYNYNSIIAIQVDSSGRIRKNLVVPKFQNSMDDDGYYLSYALAINEAGMHFIFLDNPRNASVSSPAEYRVMNRPQRADVVCISLFFDGTLRKSVLFNTEQAGWVLRPKFSRQIASNELVVMAIGGTHRIRMCRITVPAS